jgi:hypothetical protein
MVESRESVALRERFYFGSSILLGNAFRLCSDQAGSMLNVNHKNDRPFDGSISASQKQETFLKSATHKAKIDIM